MQKITPFLWFDDKAVAPHLIVVTRTTELQVI
jgi:hypothetical protein